MAVTEPKRYVTMATLMKDIYTERLLESEASLLPVRKSVKKNDEIVRSTNRHNTWFQDETIYPTLFKQVCSDEGRRSYNLNAIIQLNSFDFGVPFVCPQLTNFNVGISVEIGKEFLKAPETAL